MPAYKHKFEKVLTSNMCSIYTNVNKQNKHSKEGYRMNYIWKKYSFAIILFILTFVMGIYVIFSSNSNTNEYVIITVQDGESLWSISERYAHNLGVTTSEFVNMLEEKNELKHKLIKSGEQLKVPTPNEKLDNLDNHERQFVIQTE